MHKGALPPPRKPPKAARAKARIKRRLASFKLRNKFAERTHAARRTLSIADGTGFASNPVAAVRPHKRGAITGSRRGGAKIKASKNRRDARNFFDSRIYGAPLSLLDDEEALDSDPDTEPDVKTLPTVQLGAGSPPALCSTGSRFEAEALLALGPSQSPPLTLQMRSHTLEVE